MDKYEKDMFSSTISIEELRKFFAGVHYEAYKLFGAHLMDINNEQGVRFVIWAPGARSVSVVGDFNQWNTNTHEMHHIFNGVFELFVPWIKAGDLYKYAIHLKDGSVVYKSDPYGTYMELRPNCASIVYNIEKCHQWQDHHWMTKRKKEAGIEKPQFIYELHLGGFLKPDTSDFYNYKELAVKVADYVLDMGYTHVEIMPVMEHPYDPSWGYQVTGYYAPTSRYGTPEDFMYFVDYLHQKDIGVILDWVPAHFPKDRNGLAKFDGGPLYEDPNPKRGEHRQWGTLVFDYGRKEISNFLIANALYWVEQYHIDGLRMDAVASMLYLDYERESGEWQPNMYGGNINLESVEFLKHLNSIMKKRNPDIQMIAEESTAFPKVTGPVEKDSLGFDFKWNMGWMNDFLEFMKLDFSKRKKAYNQLLFSMIYAYSEKYILVLSHDEVAHGKKSMIGKMPGDYKEKFSNLRLAYGYMVCHPGKKLLFMGQDYAQFEEFDVSKSLEWFMLDFDMHKKMQDYMRELIHLYKNYPALSELDHDPNGFNWTNCLRSEECMVSFLRKTKKKTDSLLILCNFSPNVQKGYFAGVPYKGKYKEIFNSDAVCFGGDGNVNSGPIQSDQKECDDMNYSICITVPALGMCIFECGEIDE